MINKPGHYTLSPKDYDKIVEYLEYNGEPSETVKKAAEAFKKLREQIKVKDIEQTIRGTSITACNIDELEYEEGEE